VRALLALLLADASRVVSADRLIDGIHAGPRRRMPISGCVDVARVAAAGKALIGDDAFETEYERGLAVSPDEALTLAGGAHSPSSSTPV
jgi:hypothetical protein